MNTIMKRLLKHLPLTWFLLPPLMPVLVCCGDCTHFVASLKTNQETFIIEPALLVENEKILLSPKITFQSHGKSRMSTCMITIYWDKNQNSKRDEDEPTHHWPRNWPSGSETQVILPPQKEKLTAAELESAAVIRFEVEVTFTSGGQYSSSGIVDRVKDCK